MFGVLVPVCQGVYGTGITPGFVWVMTGRTNIRSLLSMDDQIKS